MSFTSPEFAQKPDGSHRRGRRIAVIALAVVVVAGLVAVIVAVATGGSKDTRTAGLAPPPQAATGTATVSAAPVSWMQVGPVQLPFSDTAGPTVQEGVLARGYAHSADGALIAALQIPMRVYALSGTDEIIDTQISGTDADRAELRTQAARLQASLDPGQVLPRAFAWRFFEPYDDGDTTFDIATPAAQSGQYQVFRFTVVWVGGDWRYQPNFYPSPADPIPGSAITADAGWHQFTDRSLR